MRSICAALFVLCLCAPAARAGDLLRLIDGTVIEADEVWDDPHGVWYRQGGVTYSVERARIKSIERAGRAAAKSTTAPASSASTQFDSSSAHSSAATERGQVARLVETGDLHHAASAATKPDAASHVNASDAAGVEILRGGVVKRSEPAGEPVTIHLVGGASFEADEASETAEGVWYKRAGLSIFIDRARIERVERGGVEAAEASAEVAHSPARRERRWTTGSARLDQLIRQNGARHGVDPYLVFLVMEQESHFNSRAVSPVGARGLMQLMPGTAARFGVRDAHDPAQNVSAGTRYLKLLLNKFNGRVDLVLAGYNAGEGNVTKYGYRVPPFRETRNYVRKITGRYGRTAHATVATMDKANTTTTKAAATARPAKAAAGREAP